MRFNLGKPKPPIGSAEHALRQHWDEQGPRRALLAALQTALVETGTSPGQAAAYLSHLATIEVSIQPFLPMIRMMGFTADPREMLELLDKPDDLFKFVDIWKAAYYKQGELVGSEGAATAP